jgi:hypothetical protein
MKARVVTSTRVYNGKDAKRERKLRVMRASGEHEVDKCQVPWWYGGWRRFHQTVIFKRITLAAYVATPVIFGGVTGSGV